MTLKKDGIRERTLTLYDDTLYTEKALFWLATNWRRAHYAIGVPSVICSALVGGALVKDLPSLALVLTALAGILTALLTFLDPKAQFTRYHECGVSYAILRGKIERFKGIDLAGTFDGDQARATLEALAIEKGDLQKKAPHTGGIAYYFAKRSIKRGEHVADQRGAS